MKKINKILLFLLSFYLQSHQSTAMQQEDIKQSITFINDQPNIIIRFIFTFSDASGSNASGDDLIFFERLPRNQALAVSSEFFKKEAKLLIDESGEKYRFSMPTEFLQPSKTYEIIFSLKDKQPKCILKTNTQKQDHQDLIDASLWASSTYPAQKYCICPWLYKDNVYKILGD